MGLTSGCDFWVFLWTSVLPFWVFAIWCNPGIVGFLGFCWFPGFDGFLGFALTSVVLTDLCTTVVLGFQLLWRLFVGAWGFRFPGGLV